MTISQQNRAFEKLCERLGCVRRIMADKEVKVINQNGVSVWLRGVDGIFIGSEAPPVTYGISPLHHFSPNFRKCDEHRFELRLQLWKEAIQRLLADKDDGFLLVTRLTIIVAMIEELMAEENLQSVQSAQVKPISPCGCALPHTANA